MRSYFPNLTRPKKAAKRLAALIPDIKLSQAQAGVAKTLGYKDWHDLETHHADSPASPLDERLPKEAFHDRIAEHSVRFATAIGVDDGLAQYVLSLSGLTGNRTASPEDHAIIRTMCWRRTCLPTPRGRGAGAIVRLKGPSDKCRYGFLRKGSNRPVHIVTNRGLAARADFEVSLPRIAPDDFVPLRLRLPYGCWTEADGSKVLFSRDYCPMWRLQDGRPAERVAPWTHIKFVDQAWFWADSTGWWHSEEIRVREERRLLDFGVVGLPPLVDALPILVNNSREAVSSIHDAVAAMVPADKRHVAYPGLRSWNRNLSPTTEHTA